MLLAMILKRGKYTIIIYSRNLDIFHSHFSQMCNNYTIIGRYIGASLVITYTSGHIWTKRCDQNAGPHAS